MRRTFILELVLLTLLSTGILSAQEVWVLLQGGRSYYGALYIGTVEGSGSDQDWKPGPILGVGIRLKTSSSFCVDGTVEYSTHPFAPPTWSEPVKGDPRNKIIDVNAVGRVNFSLVGPVVGSFSFGAGYWHQTKDPGETASGIGLVLGLGLGIELAEKWGLYFDGSIRGRQYTTPVLQLGLAYQVH